MPDAETQTVQPTLPILPIVEGKWENRTSDFAQKLTVWVEDRDWVPDPLNHTVAILILFVCLLAAASFLYFIFRPLILRLVKKLVGKTEFTWDNELLGRGVFRWLTHLLPGLLIYLVSPGLFSSVPWLVGVLRVASSIYILIACYLAFDSILNALQTIYSRTPAGKRLNLATFTQVAKLLAALICVILGIAILIGKSPLTLLGGLGVFASVLMLVFKDVILGFVAGIQLASNRMLSQGDWLEMPSYQADGDVVEIGLTTVKVQNWDKTITTIPTYALISDSFKNWRGMSDSGGRRIKRSILVDTNSIRLCTAEMLTRFHEIEHISDYLQAKEKEIAKANASLDEARPNNRVNGRRLTNVGTFRAYIEAYLKHHPDINKRMTLLVRQLAPEGRGIPIEIYCFSANQNWGAYEAIQADIFDHLLAVAPEFDLRIFQEPTGLDFREAKIG
jgi:miniconductance mechanosensitive channel